MKIQKIATFAISTARQISKPFVTPKNATKTVLQSVPLPIVAYYLQNENEARKKLFNDSLNGQYVLQNQSDNINHITELENMGIIKSQQPWDAPPFDNGILTDTKYEEVVKNIKETTLLTDTQKQKHLKRLADNNYKVNFTGSPEVSAEDLDLDSEYMMNPELEAIYHAPPIETPEGLVKTIFGELPPEVDIDMDLWSSLKSMAKGLFGSWLE